MGKLLFWIVIIIAVLCVARRPHGGGARRAPGFPAARRPPSPAAAQTMVRCAHCGIHLPRSEALLQNGRTWCSADHAQRGPTGK